MSYPEFLIDKRVLQRNIGKGVVDAKEYEKGLAKLPDVQSNAEASGPFRGESRDDDDSED